MQEARKLLIVKDELGNPLPNVQFSKIVDGEIIPLKTTDKNGRVDFVESLGTIIKLSHESGATEQDQFDGFDDGDVITLQTNGWMEKNGRLVGLATVGGLLLVGAITIATGNKPLPIKI